MDRERFAVSLVCYSTSVESLEDAFRELGIPVLILDKFTMPVWKFFMRLRAVIKNTAPDIVHTWLYSANFWGRWAAFTSGVPHIVASHRSVVVRRRGARYLLEKTSERLLAKRAVRLANSRAVARSLERHFALPVDKTIIMPNGVGLAACDREAARIEIRRGLGLPEKQKLVIMVARQDVGKNYPMFLSLA